MWDLHWQENWLVNTRPGLARELGGEYGPGLDREWVGEYGTWIGMRMDW